MNNEGKIIAVDPSKCSGCRYCEVACSFKHSDSCSYNHSLIRVVRDDRECYYLPLVCQHCDAPACLEACPTGAIAKEESGRVVIAEESCNGCLACTTACPYSVPENLSLPLVQPEKDIALICDLCDGDPLCARLCPTGALQYLPRHQAKAFPGPKMEEIRRLLAGTT